MKLQGVEYGSAIGASGIDNFYPGVGYPYHWFLKAVCPWGFSFKGMTHCAKTFTLERNEGNMPLREDGLTPVELKPDCIFVNARSFRKCAALNAVKLSNFGAEFYFKSGRFQALTEPFMMSFMSIKQTVQERLAELKAFVKLLLKYMPGFKAKFALQINFSCPNVGLHLEELIHEVRLALDIAAELGIPLIPKINVMVPVEAAVEFSRHPECAAIALTNTLLWGSLPDRIDWKDLFGTDESPLKKYGGGGGSGAFLFPLLLEWLDRANGLVKKPIIAGGGIMGPRNVRTLSCMSNVTAIAAGSITMLRPWRLQATIREAHRSIGQRI